MVADSERAPVDAELLRGGLIGDYAEAAVEFRAALELLDGFSEDAVSRLDCRKARTQAYLALVRYHQGEPEGVLEELEISWGGLEQEGLLG